MFKKVLIANRGEIACRIHATCQKLGVETATVHSSIDCNSRHVKTIGESIQIGGPPAADSYLNIKAIVDAALAVEADAVHPGIGFLSEDPAFVSAVENAGLSFIGPTADTIERFADKGRAKVEAQKVGVPVIEGSVTGSSDPVEISAWARQRGFPLLLKATAGGGGRGIRIIKAADELESQIESAMREAKAAFGTPDLLIEQYVANARHIEVQVAGDGCGEVIHFYERECSLQRRQQKVIEEAPAPGLDEPLRQAIIEAACKIAEAANYRGLGTVEFLVDGDNFYFLELNPRLQVEHPVTESVTGFDLVEIQLLLCSDRQLPIKQEDVRVTGHSIEARVYAEDVRAGFIPSTGLIHDLYFDQQQMRVDCGVDAGEEISAFYDSMVAKVVCLDSTRERCILKLHHALKSSYVLGVQTNIDFLRALLSNNEVLSGPVDNGFIDRELDHLLKDSVPTSISYAVTALSRLLVGRVSTGQDPWTLAQGFTGWRMSSSDKGRRKRRLFSYKIVISDIAKEITVTNVDREGLASVYVDDERCDLKIIRNDPGHLSVEYEKKVLNYRHINDQNYVYTHSKNGTVIASVSDYISSVDVSRSGRGGIVQAPVMGQVVKVNVEQGDEVSAGDVLIIQESMKIEIQISAPRDGTVVKLNCNTGDMIERHSVIAEVG